ncbi:MAG: C45 family peptidase, partial [Syntrophorhabdus sp.]
MKKILSVMMIAGFFIFLAYCFVFAKEPAGVAGSGLTYVSQFEGGKLYTAGRIKVLELTGNYRQMGRQYGALVKDDLSAIHRTIGDVFVAKRKMSPAHLATVARAIFDRYPQRYKEIINGMAETSGLDKEKLMLVNAVEWLPKIDRLSYEHCSGIGVWGPYTGKGPLVFGRNNDDDPIYFNFSRMVVAVFKPNDGSIPTALINYAGVIYNTTGMNAEGLFTELNAGPWLGFSLDRISIFTTLFSYLQDYRNLEEFDKAMMSTLVDISSIINVADPRRAYSYECTLWDTKRREQDAEGVIAAANAFSLPGWHISPIDPLKDDTSQIRKRNLLALAAKHKGSINPAVMMNILDHYIPDGGATNKGTIYQVVAHPAELTIWLKVPGRIDWTEIPLRSVF